VVEHWDALGLMQQLGAPGNCVSFVSIVGSEPGL
jgi:hypothetical protein